VTQCANGTQLAPNKTKTKAGEREIPISPMLRTMLLEWRLTCPRLDG
jgi:hypothetical protein